MNQPNQTTPDAPPPGPPQVNWGLFAMFATIVIGSVVVFSIRPQPLAARQQAACRQNLGLIGLSAVEYHTNFNAFPPDLDALFAFAALPPKVGQCPVHRAVDDRIPVGDAAPAAQPTNAGCDYAYVAGLSLDSPADWILAFDRPGNHPDGGGNVVYVRGRVRYFPGESFHAELIRFEQAYRDATGETPTIIGLDE